MPVMTEDNMWSAILAYEDSDRRRRAWAELMVGEEEVARPSRLVPQNGAELEAKTGQGDDGSTGSGEGGGDHNL